MAPHSERLPEPHGTPRNGKIGNFTDFWLALSVFLLLRPSAAVSFIYQFRVGCWASMAAHSERLPEPHGTPRNGKIGKLRVESGILRISGSSFRFSACVAHPRRFRVFSYHFRVGCWVLMAKTTADGRRRKKTERMSQKSVKFRMLFAIFQFYHSVGFRGVPGGVPKGRPSTPNTQRGNDK